jgi:hypothetical protein
VIDELYAPELAGAAKRWITPFRASFPDVHMELVELIAEGDKVVGRFTCSATHLGAWLGRAPTGRRFERVNEVWILRFRDGRIVHVWSLDRAPSKSRFVPFVRDHVPRAQPYMAALIQVGGQSPALAYSDIWCIPRL